MRSNAVASRQIVEGCEATRLCPTAGFRYPSHYCGGHRASSADETLPSLWRASRGEFPEGVTHKAQYGTRLRAFAVYLKNYGFLSYQRTAEALSDLFAIAVSAGTLASTDGRCARRLERVVEQIREKLVRAPVHFDETGLSINGKLHWLHGASNPAFTYYFPHERRGQAATDAMGILPRLKGNAVHDNWQPYMKYRCPHSLCNAHQIRELTAIYEFDGQPWAQQMIGLLLESNQAVEGAKKAGKKRLAAGGCRDTSVAMRRLLLLESRPILLLLVDRVVHAGGIRREARHVTSWRDCRAQEGDTALHVRLSSTLHK